MKRQEYWDSFLRTGKIQDYLSYLNGSDERDELENVAFKSQWFGNQGAEGFGERPPDYDTYR